MWLRILDAIEVRYEALPAVVVCRTPADDVVLHEGRARIWRRSTTSASVMSTRLVGADYTRHSHLCRALAHGESMETRAWLPVIRPAGAH